MIVEICQKRSNAEMVDWLRRTRSIVQEGQELLEVLRTEGVQIVGEMQEYDYGKFGWILDPEGNKIELRCYTTPS